MMILNRISFNTKLTILFLSVTLMAMSFLFIFDIYQSKQHNRKILLEESLVKANLIGDSSVVALTFSDKVGAQNILNRVVNIENIDQAILYDQMGEPFSIFNKTNAPIPTIVKAIEHEYIEDSLHIYHPIVYDRQFYGTLFLKISTSELDTFLQERFIALFLFSMFVMLFIYLGSRKLQLYITKPIVDLAQIVRQITINNDYSIQIQSHSSDEIGVLYEDFNKMLSNIEKHKKERNIALIEAKEHREHLEELTKELESRVKERTKELENSLNTLTSAQAKLIESEKMASLGNLVSGVAHEVNTPLGNAVTASSLINENSALLLTQLNDNTLKKSTLESTLLTLNETSVLISNNLHRAAELIKSFKKISVDQSNEDKREFEIGEYIKEIFMTFHNQIKQLPIEINIQTTSEIIILSYPGIIAQIISNLIQNSLFHAFDDGRDGQIDVYIKEDETYVIIEYKDNGKGIEPNFITKVYEPFITTKRNQGGSGLGLNIVYNLITQKLKGTIDISSQIGEGTQFVISIPKV
jgi:C4-dicarboxylate-specific signal transduction histidine kinase